MRTKTLLACTDAVPSGISAGTATLAQPIAHTAQQPASIISMEDEDMTPDQIQCR